MRLCDIDQIPPIGILKRMTANVTGAVSNCEGNYSVRSHRNRIWRQVAVSCLSDRSFDRWYKSNSGHALLCCLDWGCGGRGTRSLPYSLAHIGRDIPCQVASPHSLIPFLGVQAPYQITIARRIDAHNHSEGQAIQSHVHLEHVWR